MLRRSLRGWALLPALVLGWGTAGAQSLRDLYLGALVTDPVLAGAEAQYQASQQRVRQARAVLLPSVDLTGSSSSSTFKPDDGSLDRDFHTDRWSVRLTQAIYKPGSYSALDEAQQSLAMAEAQLDAAEADLAARLTTSYFDVLGAREALLSLTREKEAAVQQMALAKRSYDLGTVAITDLREAEAKHDLTAAQEEAAANDLALKRAELLQMVGEVEYQLPVLPKEAPDPQVDTEDLALLTQEALERNPAVLQARYQAEAAGASVKKARADRLPSINFSVSYGSDNSTGTPSNPVPVDGRTMQTEASLSLPLFSSFAISAKIGEAQALEAKAQADLNQAERETTTRLRQAYFGLRSALRQIASLRTAKKSSDIAVRAQRKGYGVGMSATADVLEAESQYSQVQRDLMKARLDAYMNQIKLQIALGRPWRESVDALASIVELEIR